MKDVTQQEKDAIRDALRVYADRYASQNKAAASLNGVSAGTMSVILNGKYDTISDEMWRNISAQVSTPARQGWQVVETTVYQEMWYALRDAQQYRTVRWVLGEAGCGKTTTAGVYAQDNRDVFVVLCDEGMRKIDFIRDVTRRIGIRSQGLRTRDMMEEAIVALTKLDSPLLVFDEGDKLPDHVFHYFIHLYNRLEGKCGIVFLSTRYAKKRIEDGVSYNKRGYSEIYSRVGRKFFELEPIDPNDVYAICQANGLTEKKQIAKVVQVTEPSSFDLRCVKREVHAIKRLNAI